MKLGVELNSSYNKTHNLVSLLPNKLKISIRNFTRKR